MMREVDFADNSFLNAVARVKEAREAKDLADQEYDRALKELQGALEAHAGLKTLLRFKRVGE